MRWISTGDLSESDRLLPSQKNWRAVADSFLFHLVCCSHHLYFLPNFVLKMPSCLSDDASGIILWILEFLILAGRKMAVRIRVEIVLTCIVENSLETDIRQPLVT